MNKSVLSFSSIGLLACIFLLINSLSSSLFSRFSIDLTEESLYSVSESTEKILSSLDEPIVIRFYFSRIDSLKNAAVQLYATRVRDLLREYERISSGMITLEEYDAQPDSEEEEWAIKYGLKALGLPTGEKLYFGMVATNSSGEDQTIPLFNINRQETLEYDITKSIYALSRTSVPKVGIISPLKIAGEEAPLGPNGMPAGPAQQPWVLVNQLKSVVDVEFLGMVVERIPEDIDVLMVIHPKSMVENTKYAIDQFVMRGGSLFLAVDPYCASDVEGIDPRDPMAMVKAERSSDLNSLIAPWGVSLKGKNVIGDPTLATAVSAGRGQGPQDFLVWLSFGQNKDERGNMLLNSDQIITSQLSNLMFAWPGALETREVEGIELTPLIQTSTTAGLYDEQAMRFLAQNPPELLKQFKPSGSQQIIAAMLRGKFKSGFSGKPGSQDQEQASSSVGGHIPQGVDDATVVVVSDVDFLSNNYSAVVQNVMGYNLVTLINENLALATNTIELLGGSNDLVALRSRGSFLRPFTKVKEIEALAQDRWRAEELRLQKEANEASQRLQQLQSVGAKSGEAVFSAALLEEMKQLREQRRLAGERLREVRWQLRKDKESLGNWIFVLNTFAVPLLLVIGAIYCAWRKNRSNA